MTKNLPILFTATVLTYAAGYPLGSASVAVMPPGLVILLRFALSAVVLWILVATLHLPLPDRRTLRHAVVAGLLTQGVQFLFLYEALSYGVSAGLGALIIALNPVLTAVLLTAFTSHKETGRGVLSLILAVAAVTVACLPQILSEDSTGWALPAVIIALLGLSLGGIHQGRHLQNMHPLVITAVGVTASTPFAGVVAALEGGATTNWPHALGLIVMMVVISSLGASTLYAVCIRRSGARAASVLFSVIPATAGLMAWATLGESLTLFTVTGIVLGALACLLQQTGRSKALPAD